jgi:hypothetical protein
MDGITIKESELSLVDEKRLSGKQLKFILSKTPKKYVKTRPAKGGGTWDYVSGGYVKKCLNLMFGWDWDFEIVDEQVLLEAKQVIVKGKLTCRSHGATIIKMQYGRQDIKFRKNSEAPLDLGNDLKGAATDALKKCASEIGIASDIYAKEEFREVQVEETDDRIDELIDLFMDLEEKLSEEQAIHIRRIIKEKDKASYNKAIKILKDVEDS